jgi:hypothetical protein|tara:strand:+ start:736 stop:957 length:222 start_codon:yes stop_codon:yes gene_type:complete
MSPVPGTYEIRVDCLSSDSSAPSLGARATLTALTREYSGPMAGSLHWSFNHDGLSGVKDLSGMGNPDPNPPGF